MQHVSQEEGKTKVLQEGIHQEEGCQKRSTDRDDKEKLFPRHSSSTRGWPEALRVVSDAFSLLDRDNYLKASPSFSLCSVGKNNFHSLWCCPAAWIASEEAMERSWLVPCFRFDFTTSTTFVPFRRRSPVQIGKLFGKHDTSRPVDVALFCPASGIQSNSSNRSFPFGTFAFSKDQEAKSSLISIQWFMRAEP